jgi:hypothetical protein
MAPGPSHAKKLFLQRVSVTDPPRPAVDWLIGIVLTEGWFTNKADAREAAERWENQFLALLRKELSDCNDLGKFYAFEFNSSSPYMLQGCAFVEPRDSPSIREAKANRARHDSYVSALGALSPVKFEALCTGLLSVIGIEQPVLTSYSADEGIDFYGKLRLQQFVFSDHHFPGIQQQLTAWMIGQAKHYADSEVSTLEIRELVGSVELAKGKAFSSVGENYVDLELRVCDPVFYLFFTTGRLTSSSWRLLVKSGVVGMDGKMIAALLADKQIGVTGGSFDSAEFDAWIRRFLK